MKKSKLDPAKDGVDHIRIHRNARTRLGRYLAGCAVSVFTVPGWGTFKSLDAFRVAIVTGTTRAEVRGLSMERAEREASYLPREALEKYADAIDLAFRCKLDQTRFLSDGTLLREAFDKEELPFVCYELDDGMIEEDALPSTLPDDIPDYIAAELKRTRSRAYLLRNQLPSGKRRKNAASSTLRVSGQPTQYALA